MDSLRSFAATVFSSSSLSFLSASRMGSSSTVSETRDHLFIMSLVMLFLSPVPRGAASVTPREAGAPASAAAAMPSVSSLISEGMAGSSDSYSSRGISSSSNTAPQFWHLEASLETKAPHTGHMENPSGLSRTSISSLLRSEVGIISAPHTAQGPDSTPMFPHSGQTYSSSSPFFSAVVSGSTVSSPSKNTPQLGQLSASESTKAPQFGQMKRCWSSVTPGGAGTGATSSSPSNTAPQLGHESEFSSTNEPQSGHTNRDGFSLYQ